MSSFAAFFGRLMLAAIFIVAGAGKLGDLAGTDVVALEVAGDAIEPVRVEPRLAECCCVRFHGAPCDTRADGRYT